MSVADSPKLTTPLLDVVLADGTVAEVQTDNRDLVLFDRTRAKHRWAAAMDSPSTWVTFLAWAHLRREKLIPAEMTWESFADEHCLQAAVRDEPEGDGPATPTLPGLGLG